MSDMRRLLEAVSKYRFANPVQKPGDQVRGTEKAKPNKSGKHPFQGRLVGAGESILKELEHTLQQPKSKSARSLMQEYRDFLTNEITYQISDFKENTFESMSEFRQWMRSPKTNCRGMTRHSVDRYENIFPHSNVMIESNTDFSRRRKQAKIFSTNFKKLDHRDQIKIKVGNKLALLSATIIPDDTNSRIELSGFINPKEIKKIHLDHSNKIDSLEFTDGSRFPESAEFTSVGGINITNTIFFPNYNIAAKAYTNLWMMISNLEGQGWNIEHYTNETLNEYGGVGGYGSAPQSPQGTTGSQNDPKQQQAQKDLKTMTKTLQGVKPAVASQGGTDINPVKAVGALGKVAMNPSTKLGPAEANQMAQFAGPIANILKNPGTASQFKQLMTKAGTMNQAQQQQLAKQAQAQKPGTNPGMQQQQPATKSAGQT
jgi:hypothetical protein